MTGLAADIARVWRLVVIRRTVYLLMVASLSLAYCATIVIGLYVHSELTYDRFLPNSDRVYLVSAKYGPLGRPLLNSDRTPAGVGRWLGADMPEVSQVTRLDTQEWPVKSGRRMVKERFYWADANVFRVLQFPALHGDLQTALLQPGSAVLTRRLAIAYFGSDEVVGQKLTLNKGVTLTVTAVLKDFPSNSHLDREMFVAGGSTFSRLYTYDHDWTLLWPNTYTYVTFRQNEDLPGLARQLSEITRRHWQGQNNLPDSYEFVPITHLHFKPHADGEMKPRGHLDSVLAMVGVAIVVLALACINFTGLILAGRTERIAELKIFRALGAQPSQIFTQLFREVLTLNALGLWIGLAISERLLPFINAGLDLNLVLWQSHVFPLALIVVLAGAVLIGSGIVPAVRIARLDTPSNARTGALTLRWQGWMIAQLALVIVLLFSSHTLWRQWTYATKDALGFDADNVVMIKLGDDWETQERFKKDIRSVEGIVAVAESWGAPTNEFARPGWIHRPDRSLIAFSRNSVDPAFFDVYGVKLLAGRNLSGTFLTPEVPKEVIINLAAAQALGFATPEDAIGRGIDYDTDQTHMRSTIVGVAPNLRIGTVYEPMQPMLFDGFSKYFTQENIRIEPGKTASTLREIDRLWRRDSEGTVPIERRFFHDYLSQQYHDLNKQLRVFYMVSGLAILLSVFGLTGLSIFITQRQIQELAIHRAMGANFGDLFWERLKPFGKPLLLAIALALPFGWLIMQIWLKAFSDHVTLSWSSAMVAAGATALFGFVTIATHLALTVKDVPVSALRSE